MSRQKICRDSFSKRQKSASTASPSMATRRPTTPSCCSLQEQAASTIDASNETSNGQFQEALNAVCIDLAKQIVADGEGVNPPRRTPASSGAPTDADALQVAKTIAHSPLVKTAWAGNDPNWGRILAAIGAREWRSIPARSHIHGSATTRSAATAAYHRSWTSTPPTYISQPRVSGDASISASARAPAASGPAT
jgi:hypothetical protein